MIVRISMLILTFSGLIACGDDKGGDPVNGEAVYNSSCASCHGAGGVGVDNLGPALAGTTLSDDQIADVIENGMGTMPGNLISGTDVDDVLAYIGSL